MSARPDITDPQLAAYVDQLETEAAALVDAVASAYGAFRWVEVTAQLPDVRDASRGWAQEMSAALKAAPALTGASQTAAPVSQRIRD